MIAFCYRIEILRFVFSFLRKRKQGLTTKNCDYLAYNTFTILCIVSRASFIVLPLKHSSKVIQQLAQLLNNAHPLFQASPESDEMRKTDRNKSNPQPRGFLDCLSSIPIGRKPVKCFCEAIIRLFFDLYFERFSPFIP